MQVNFRATALHPAQTDKNEGILLVQLERKNKSRDHHRQACPPARGNGRKTAVTEGEHPRKRLPGPANLPSPSQCTPGARPIGFYRGMPHQTLIQRTVRLHFHFDTHTSD